METNILNLADYLEASARRFPERIAVVNPNGASITYRELEAQAELVATFLGERGVGPGDRVALLMPKCAQTVAAIFGILKARAAYVPIDWNAPSSRVQAILADCRTRAVFVDARALAKLGEDICTQENAIVVGPLPDELNIKASSAIVSWADVMNHKLPPALRTGRTRDDLAYILYTSGSTGIPKGVMVSQGNALSFVRWCSSVFQPSEEDRFSSHAPFHFDLSILDIYVPLKHGGSMHLIDDETGKNPKELAKFIAERRLTVWYSTPSILHLLASFGNLARYDYSKLRTVLFAGEVFPVKQLRQLTQYWPTPHYYNLYGPTETNVCTYASVPSKIPESRTEPYPIGMACAHCSAAVLDSDRQPVAPAGEGILHIAGESVFQGYWNRPAETSAAFFLRDGERWYSTGDVVREDPELGFIYVGRRDRMVKRHGYRIELDDIECALYRHEQMREVAVIAAAPGGAEVKIAAYVVAGSDPPPTIVQMKIYCASQLPSYMNPDVFVLVTALPRTSTNKVDYQALSRQFEHEFGAPLRKA